MMQIQLQHALQGDLKAVSHVIEGCRACVVALTRGIFRLGIMASLFALPGTLKPVSLLA